MSRSILQGQPRRQRRVSAVRRVCRPGWVSTDELWWKGAEKKRRVGVERSGWVRGCQFLSGESGPLRLHFVLEAPQRFGAGWRC